VRIDWLRQFSVTIQSAKATRSGKNRFRASLVLSRHYLGGSAQGQRLENTPLLLALNGAG
jgi:hypothetical protein